MFRPASPRSILRVLAIATATLACPPGASAETVYFVGKDSGRLFELNTVGGAITALTGSNTFPNATALAFGPDGNLYVGDAEGGGSIKRYVIASGSVSTVTALNGGNPAFSGGPVNPGAIAFAPHGTMLVGRNPEVAFFPGSLGAWPGGSVLGVAGWRVGESPSISSYTSGTSQNYSAGLAFGSDGTLYASNSLYDPSTFVMTGNVLRFANTGSYQSVAAVDGSGTGGLFGPTGLAVSGNNLFIASTMNGNIYKTDLANPNPATNTSLFAASETFIGPLAMLADGNVLAGYVGGVQGRGNIFMFDTAGTKIATFGGEEYGPIGGIAAVPEPTTLVLVGVGGAALGLSRLLRRRT